MTLLDFVKSVDTVYKELSLMRASVANNSKMDRAFEKIINLGFYFVLACVVLSVMGVDPLVLFASISGFILAFAFMVGSAAAKYFEGLLLILVRVKRSKLWRLYLTSDPDLYCFTGSTSL